MGPLIRPQNRLQIKSTNTITICNNNQKTFIFTFDVTQYYSILPYGAGTAYVIDPKILTGYRTLGNAIGYDLLLTITHSNCCEGDSVTVTNEYCKLYLNLENNCNIKCTKPDFKIVGGILTISPGCEFVCGPTKIFPIPFKCRPQSEGIIYTPDPSQQNVIKFSQPKPKKPNSNCFTTPLVCDK
jgi:hypothetical protein